MTNQVSVLQQMYVNQGQFIIEKQPTEKFYCEPPQYWKHFLLPLLLGILICGVPLASMVTLYVRTQYCTSVSTTTTATATSTTAVTTQTSVNQANSSEPAICEGIASHTLWVTFSTNGITILIDTSSCNFNSTPLYFTSMAGTTSHWDLAGYTAIYYPAKNSFRVYARSLTGLNCTQLLSNAQSYAWNVNWFAISN